MKAQHLSWKVDTNRLFEEIIGSNSSMWIMQQPLRITYSIMREAAVRALELQDEKMIAICARLGLYEACDPKHEEHEKLMKIVNKFYN